MKSLRNATTSSEDARQSIPTEPTHKRKPQKHANPEVEWVGKTRRNQRDVRKNK